MKNRCCEARRGAVFKAGVARLPLFCALLAFCVLFACAFPACGVAAQNAAPKADPKAGQTASSGAPTATTAVSAPATAAPATATAAAPGKEDPFALPPNIKKPDRVLREEAITPEVDSRIRPQLPPASLPGPRQPASGQPASGQATPGQLTPGQAVSQPLPGSMAEPGPNAAPGPYASEDELRPAFSQALNILNPFTELDETGQFLSLLEPFVYEITNYPLSITIKSGRAGADAWGGLPALPKDGNSAAIVMLPNLITRGLHPYPTYHLDDVAPEFLLAELPLALWVPEGSPFKTLQDLTRFAFNNPEQLIIGGGGTYSAPQLANAVFARAAGLTVGYRGYLGTADAMRAANEGRVAAVWGYALEEPGKSAKMRPLAIAARARSPVFPQLPTFDEQKVDLLFHADFGFSLPAGTAADVRALWQKVFKKLASGPEWAKAATALGFKVKFTGQPELGEWYNSQIGFYRDFIKDYGIK